MGLRCELTGPQRQLLAASYRHIAEQQTSPYLRQFFTDLAEHYELPPLFPEDFPDADDDADDELEAP